LYAADNNNVINFVLTSLEYDRQPIIQLLPSIYFQYVEYLHIQGYSKWF
jgi:hypothetical protein